MTSHGNKPKNLGDEPPVMSLTFDAVFKSAAIILEKETPL
jgi:hypothetical protein